MFCFKNGKTLVDSNTKALEATLGQSQGLFKEGMNLSFKSASIQDGYGHTSPTTPTALIVICGATATGKSGLALEMAQRMGSVILSADSRQVYQEFDIGTAKPSVAERQLVPHYLIDICEPTETMTLADYQHQAQVLIAQFQQEGQIPLLVGGTGLYIR
ncbi:MAG TPA: isopentenyl transferase family protein, partial [Oculatellaceae cyanobacterium]